MIFLEGVGFSTDSAASRGAGVASEKGSVSVASASTGWMSSSISDSDVEWIIVLTTRLSSLL